MYKQDIRDVLRTLDSLGSADRIAAALRQARCFGAKFPANHPLVYALIEYYPWGLDVFPKTRGPYGESSKPDCGILLSDGIEGDEWLDCNVWQHLSEFMEVFASTECYDFLLRTPCNHTKEYLRTDWHSIVGIMNSKEILHT